MPPATSIQDQFRDSIILLTGATGYVGGLVLEALLRTTQVHKVYVLLRSKAGQSPSDRLAGLLQVCHTVSCSAVAPGLHQLLYPAPGSSPSSPASGVL